MTKELSERVKAYKNSILSLLLLLIVTFSYVFLFAKLQNDWWFEDDPGHVYYARQYANFLPIFTDRQAIIDFSYGRTLTPMLAFSFWIDQQVAPLSAGFAYFHSGFIVILTSVLLFFLLRPHLSHWLALAASGLWPFLPSSQAVIEFLAARHYLEGITFVLISLLLARKALEKRALSAQLWILAASISYFLAAICKEVEVTTGLWLLLWLIVFARRYELLPFPLLSGVAYLVYRLTMIQGAKGFESMWGYFETYPTVLKRMPFLFLGHSIGSVVLGLLFVLLCVACIKKRIQLRHLLFFASNLAIALVTVFPVSIHVAADYLALGTWYRVVFVSNLILWCGAFWLLDRNKGWFRWPIAVIGLVGLSLGGWQARENWDERKQLYREEAEYYLSHPDQLFFSQVPAAWFIPSVHLAYTPELPPRVLTRTLTPYEAGLRIKRYSTVWTKRDGRYQSDPQLYRTVWFNTLNEIVPLNQPLPDPKDPAQAGLDWSLPPEVKPQSP